MVSATVAALLGQCDSEGSAKQNPAGTGIGALVDAGGIGAGVEQEGHPPEGQCGKHQRGNKKRLALATGELEQHKQHQRPE